MNIVFYKKFPIQLSLIIFFNGIQMGEIKTRCMVDAGKQSLE
jgi:hypothetical protein